MNRTTTACLWVLSPLAAVCWLAYKAARGVEAVCRKNEVAGIALTLCLMVAGYALVGTIE